MPKNVFCAGSGEVAYASELPARGGACSNIDATVAAGVGLQLLIVKASDEVVISAAFDELVRQRK